MEPPPAIELTTNSASLPRRSTTTTTMPPSSSSPLHRSTLLKLDILLLPFLALLFLFNSLDKSNIGNAESAHFTTDIGLQKNDLNIAVALFFAFFVVLQPVGAALGRRFGMVAWVPSCMLLWGACTAGHVWVRGRWMLFALRVGVGCLEAGFYPVTVTYLSLFYTRFEFGRRLSLFYGQAAVGGALGGVLSYLVFSHFERSREGGERRDRDMSKWQSWQVLFLLEGGLTIVVAVVGFFWLPHNVETAWFLTPEEREYASRRVIMDRSSQVTVSTAGIGEEQDDDQEYDEESRGLLNPSKVPTAAAPDVTDDRGISPHDIVSAFTSWKIWWILGCNILSAIPVYAFQVFLPLVLAPLTDTPDPALVNLMTVPPYICGAITLYLFASYSDRHRKRIFPILVGLALLITGLTIVVLLPTSKGWAIPRYIALNVLVSGCFIASPLTVAWISGNTPSPGKRALLLGINGWGNLAGLFSALLFQPKYAKDGYIVPFWWTLLCVGLAAVGYGLFYRSLQKENARRLALLATWSEEDVAREEAEGCGPLQQKHAIARVVVMGLRRVRVLRSVAGVLEDAVAGGREGDEKVTYTYGL